MATRSRRSPRWSDPSCCWMWAVRRRSSGRWPGCSGGDGGAAAVGPPRRGRGSGTGQFALQETVGQVQLPLCWMVTPQLLPLPFGLAVRTCWLGQLALMFQVAMIRAGDGTFIVTVQLLEPLTETFRL